MKQVLANLIKYVDDYITDEKAQTLEQIEVEWQKALEMYSRNGKGPAKHIVLAKVCYNSYLIKNNK
jgi:hypothetical protein